jgi:FkbM family methyltransferase
MRSFLDRRLLEGGYYEPHVIDVAHKVARYYKKKRTGQAVTVLDVGANVGIFSLALASEVDQVLSVEPYPPALKRLYANLKENNLSKVEVFEVGLGSAEDKVRFMKPEFNDLATGTFSTDVFARNPMFRNHHAHEVETSSDYLKIVRGDSLFASRSIDILKLDIEGYERYALEGLQTTMKNNRPTVFMELNKNKDGGFTSKEELLSLFPGEYQFLVFTYTLGNTCLIPFDFDFSSAAQSNLIAIPSGSEELVQELKPGECGHWWNFVLNSYILN